MTFAPAPPARPPRDTSRRFLALGLAATLAGALALACAASTASKPPTFPSGPFAPKPRGTILFVLSAANQQTLADGSKRATGTFLGEFYDPYQALLRAGHRVELATIDGRRPAIDPESLKPKYWDDVADRDRAQKLVQTSPALATPLDLKAALAKADDFQALVVPGGQGMMVDLLTNRDLETLLTRFAADDRPIGLICHAPALLTRLQAPGRLAGRRVTSVSGLEEWFIETFVMGEEAQVRGIGAALDEKGFAHEAAFPGSSHAVRDCNLVSSQNPYSTREFNRLFLDALTDHRRGGRCDR